jgi:CBS domain-containing protein
LPCKGSPEILQAALVSYADNTEKNMLKSIQVRQHMSTDALRLDPDMDILRAVHMLIKKDVSAAPVVDKDGMLVGILTERDCMRVTMQAEYHAMPGGPVSDFMTANPQSVSPDSNILDVAQAFINGRFHHYPVTQNGRLIGMISRRNVMRAMGKHYPV